MKNKNFKSQNYKFAQGSITFLRSSKITNLRKVYYKLAQVLQIGAESITNLRSYYKSAQLLQICAQHTVFELKLTREKISSKQNERQGEMYGGR